MALDLLLFLNVFFLLQLLNGPRSFIFKLIVIRTIISVSCTRPLGCSEISSKDRIIIWRKNPRRLKERESNCVTNSALLKDRIVFV